MRVTVSISEKDSIQSWPEVRAPAKQARTGNAARLGIKTVQLLGDE